MRKSPSTSSASSPTYLIEIDKGCEIEEDEIIVKFNEIQENDIRKKC